MRKPLISSGAIAPVAAVCLFTWPSLAQGPGGHPDFDGDGFADLAVAVPGEDVVVRPNTFQDAGAVSVLYGSSAGLSADGDQLWTQNSPGVLDVAEAGDEFGSSLAWGDFDGDGFDDLAVGVNDESVGSVTFAGAVHVLYGRAAGLTADGNQFWTQNSPGIPGTAEAGDGFASSLAAGDLDGDGFDDLAVGVTGEDLGSGLEDAGAVHVLYGGPSGLSSSGNELWTQDVPGVFDKAEFGDAFGFSLAAEDFDGDGFDDLAVGALGENLELRAGNVFNAGVVHILHGSASGLVSAGNQVWSQNSPGLPEVAEDDDDLGMVLATGDFDGDGFGDLAMAAPTEDLGASRANAGVVHVLYGSAAGLSATGTQLWSQDSPAVPGVAEEGDLFGFSLVSGRFHPDARDDLAVGTPGEDLSSTPGQGHGSVNVLYGSAAGLTGSNSQIFSQNDPGVPGEAESQDNFGIAVAAGDFDGNGSADLAVGVGFENVGTLGDAGAVNTFYGGNNRLSRTGSELWTQDSPGVVDQAEPGDTFGEVLPAQKGFNGFL